MENDIVEINASVFSDEGPSLSFGISMPADAISKLNLSWIYEGISDCISENWDDFDEDAEETKS